MKISSYCDWFKAGVAHWLEIAVYKAIKRIERAIEFDNLQPVDTSVQYSSSAVDTITIFYQIKVFWTQLAWPDFEGAYAFIAKIIDDICKCSTTYVDRMLEKASSNDSTNNYYEVSKSWCTAINNIEYVRSSIEPLSKDLGLNAVIEGIADQRSQQDADRCNSTLQLIVENSKDTIKNKIIDTLESIARNMLPAMKRYLMEGAELSSSSNAVTNSMDNLMGYLDSNLVTLHDNLSEDNFQRILLVIWDLVADTLYQLVHSNLEVC